MKNIYVVTGADDFLRKQAVEQTLSKITAENGKIQIKKIESGVEFGTFLHTLLGGGLFGEQTVVHAVDFFTPEVFDAFKKAKIDVKIDQSGNFLIVEQKSLPKNTKFGKFFHSVSEKKVCDAMKPKDAQTWVETQGIDASIAQKLVMRCGSDAYRLQNEVMKLKTWQASQDRATITASDMEKLTLPTPEVEIWDFLDAFRAGKAVLALQKWQTLRNAGQTGFAALPMMMREARLMLQLLAADEAGQKSGVNPWVAKKTKPIAQKAGFKHVFWLVNMLMEADLGLKTGKIVTLQGDETELDAKMSEIVWDWAKRVG